MEDDFIQAIDRLVKETVEQGLELQIIQDYGTYKSVSKREQIAEAKKLASKYDKNWLKKGVLVNNHVLYVEQAFSAKMQEITEKTVNKYRVYEFFPELYKSLNNQRDNLNEIVQSASAKYRIQKEELKEPFRKYIDARESQEAFNEGNILCIEGLHFSKNKKNESINSIVAIGYHHGLDDTTYHRLDFAFSIPN